MEMIKEYRNYKNNEKNNENDLSLLLYNLEYEEKINVLYNNYLNNKERRVILYNNLDINIITYMTFCINIAHIYLVINYSNLMIFVFLNFFLKIT